MITQTVIDVQGDPQSVFEVYTDETKEQTIGFVFDESDAHLLAASKLLLAACKISWELLQAVAQMNIQPFPFMAVALNNQLRKAIAKAEQN